MKNDTDAAALLISALKSLGFPVGRIYNTKNIHTYFVVQQLAGTPKGFADDRNEAYESLWRIDLFSKRNYRVLLKKAIAVIQEADFYGVHIGAEQYEQDTGFYHISLDARYLEE